MKYAHVFKRILLIFKKSSCSSPLFQAKTEGLQISFSYVTLKCKENRDIDKNVIITTLLLLKPHFFEILIS